MPRPPRPLEPARSASHWLGAELRHWRTVRQLTQSQLGALIHVSGDLISKLEKAERPLPEAHAESLDAVLETGGVLVRCLLLVRAETDNPPGETDDPSEEGSREHREGTLDLYVPTLDRSGTSPVERRNFLALSGLATMPAGALLNPTTHPQRPALASELRATDIEQISAAATALRQWDNLYGGGGAVRSAALAQLKWAVDLLGTRPPDAMRTELLTAVGRLGIVVGICAFDAYAHQEAQQLFTFAAECAEEVNDWHLRAASYNWRARQAIWLGSPDTGLTLAEVGLARSDRLTATERSMLNNARARAFAKMGCVQETLAAVGESDASFAHVEPVQDQTWMKYYDEAQHNGDTGHALYDLALAGTHSQQAFDRLQTAIDGHSGEYVRSRAMSMAKLASLKMACGDPLEGAAQGQLALDQVGRLRSCRAAKELADLGQQSARHRSISDVAELRQRISAAVEM